MHNSADTFMFPVKNCPFVISYGAKYPDKNAG